MTVSLRGVTAVLLPGAGSDDDYVRRAFTGPLQQVGAVLAAPPPASAGLIAGYVAALDAAAARGPIAVGGVSIGAAVGTAWALRHPAATVAVLAALPAWTGAPGQSPAADSARQTAAQLRAQGLDPVIAAMAASSPAWLAAELARSWRGQWPALPDALDEAAGFVAPDADALAGLRAPLAVAAAVDDPIHPHAVGAQWAAAAPRAALRSVTLDEIGADPAELGTACLAALAAAG